MKCYYITLVVIVYPEEPCLCCISIAEYHKDPSYWDWQAWVNNVDPDQTLQAAASE